MLHEMRRACQRNKVRRQIHLHASEALWQTNLAFSICRHAGSTRIQRQSDNVENGPINDFRVGQQ